MKAAKRSAPRAAPRQIAWWQPEVTPAEKGLVGQVLESGYLNDGDFTARFEARIAEATGAKHAVATTSGTTALFLALVASGVKAGDEVLVPDVTFIATANAVTLAGARPVLVDVDPRTLGLDPAKAARAITSRTRAIMPVHVSGRGADMRAITALARKHGLKVIEDAAEALLSMHHGRALGTWGDAGCISFSPNKTITTGQGGMVLTDDPALYQRLKELKDQGRPARGTGGDDLHPTLGFNFKLTNLQAAVGLGQFEDLERRAQRLRAIYRLYRRGLEGMKGISLFGFDVDSGESPQWVDASADRRDELVAHLAEHGMHCRKFWFPLHTQAPYRLPDTGFEQASAIVRRALWLPSAFQLTDEDVLNVCDQVRGFYHGHA